MVNIKSTLTALVVLSAMFTVTNAKKKPLPYGVMPHDINENDEVNKAYNSANYKFDGQLNAIQSSWANKQNDQFSDVTDTTKKVVLLNWWNYEEMIVDPENGEFISEKPWFVIFVHANNYESNVNIEPLQHLAAHFDGNVQFAYVSVPMEETLSYAFEVWQWPRMFYIDELGSAHAFPNGFASFNATKTWIEDREYKKSPAIFKAPNHRCEVMGHRCEQYKLWWGYAKKDIRTWYVKNWQPTIEFYLRQTPFTYVYDKDPTDWENVKLNQKTNRQIIFIISGFVWMLEFIWDLIVAATCPTKKEKPKSILNRKVADKMKEEKEGTKEEGKDEKKEEVKKEKKGKNSKKDN